ncbi:MAG: hypothetical protein KBT27_15270 [Prevotellaceae bacterium]|nr:hypothetical protein [Candidatus Faecinaster equi]
MTKQTAITNFIITDPEHAGNKVTSLDSFSNDKQYPSAKCVYDELQGKADKIETSVASFAQINASNCLNICRVTGFSRQGNVTWHYNNNEGVNYKKPFLLNWGEQIGNGISVHVIDGVGRSFTGTFNLQDETFFLKQVQEPIIPYTTMELLYEGDVVIDGSQTRNGRFYNRVENDDLRFEWQSDYKYIVIWNGRICDEISISNSSVGRYIYMDTGGYPLFFIYGDGIIETQEAGSYHFSIMREGSLQKLATEDFVRDAVAEGGGSGASAPAIQNAIETHGFGWTETEPQVGYDIQWDGNTEGLDYIPLEDGGIYKISDELYGMSSVEDLIGASIEWLDSSSGGILLSDVLHEEYIKTPDNKVFILGDANLAIVAFEDATVDELNITKGIWVFKGIVDSDGNSIRTTRLYRASTKEVVHQIDQKYIRGTYKKVYFSATSSDGGDYDISDYPDLIAAIMNWNSILYAGEVDANQLVRTIHPNGRVSFSYPSDSWGSVMTYYPDEHRLYMSMPTGTGLAIWYEGTN